MVVYKNWQMLIDVGADSQVLSCLGENIPFWDRTLELILLTHPHDDHVGGVEQVLASYQVSHLLLSDVGESEVLKKLLKALQSEVHSKMSVQSVILGQKIEFSSSGELTVLSPSNSLLPSQKISAKQFSETILSDVFAEKYYDSSDPNERSIVLLLRYFDFELLLMGDADHSNELALIAGGLIKKVEGVKVGHHGSKTSTHPEFIQQTRPEFAIISCGSNNKFGHPSTEALQLVQQHQVQVHRTDERGSIKLITDGSYYWFL